MADADGPRKHRGMPGGQGGYAGQESPFAMFAPLPRCT